MRRISVVRKPPPAHGYQASSFYSLGFPQYSLYMEYSTPEKKKIQAILKTFNILLLKFHCV